jgi:outer membrane lipoprotein-sorting protein
MPVNAKSCLKADIAVTRTKSLFCKTQPSLFSRLCQTILLVLTLLSLWGGTPVSAAKIPLPPQRPPEFGRATPPAPTQPAVPTPQPIAPVIVVPETPKALPLNTPPAVVLQRVNAALNSLTYFSAYFTQLSGNHQSEGQVYISKPGKLRFDYDPPVPTEIIADGSSVAVRDTKMVTQDIYPIGQTPLKFLTYETVDLARDFKIIAVRVEPDRVLVSMEDKATFTGTSKITLFFEQPRLTLKQWVVIDPQGVEISVVLNGINTTTKPDPKIFVIDFLRYRQQP